MKYPHGRLLIFAKAPSAGRVKTRLMPALSAAQCARLQENLIARSLRLAVRAQLCRAELWCAPDASHVFFQQCAEEFGLRLQAQQGRDLGQRMSRALSSALQEAEFAVLIGCDCPALTAKHLDRACALLAEGTDLVLGPAEDGGYVLIGARWCSEKWFENVDWGTPRVLEQTRARLRSRSLDWRELEPLWDVDRPEDLARADRCGISLCGCD